MVCSKEDIFLSQKKIESAIGNGHSCTYKCATVHLRINGSHLKNRKMVRDQGPDKVVILTPGFCILLFPYSISAPLALPRPYPDIHKRPFQSDKVHRHQERISLVRTLPFS